MEIKIVTAVIFLVGSTHWGAQRFSLLGDVTGHKIKVGTAASDGGSWSELFLQLWYKYPIHNVRMQMSGTCKCADMH